MLLLLVLFNAEIDGAASDQKHGKQQDRKDGELDLVPEVEFNSLFRVGKIPEYQVKQNKKVIEYENIGKRYHPGKKGGRRFADDNGIVFVDMEDKVIIPLDFIVAVPEIVEGTAVLKNSRPGDQTVFIIFGIGIILKHIPFAVFFLDQQFRVAQFFRYQPRFKFNKQGNLLFPDRALIFYPAQVIDPAVYGVDEIKVCMGQ